MKTKRPKEPVTYNAPQIKAFRINVECPVLCFSGESSLENYREVEYEYDD